MTPAFAYLAPLALLFGIGASAGVVCTLIYALPPLVRITEHGIRSVPDTTIEAAGSLGICPRLPWSTEMKKALALLLLAFAGIAR